MHILSQESKKSVNIRNNRLIVKKWKGFISFQESLEKQKELKDLALRGSIGFLGFESKNPTITKGLRATIEDIVWTQEKLKQYGFEEYSLHRGGQATLHAPGQLVIYPVMNISSICLKLKEFIFLLEEVTKDVLKDFGIASERTEKYVGLSTKKGKIAFFGIHLTEGISQHGLSINVSNDLSLFSSIKSCGVSNRSHDRLYDYQSISTEDLFYIWIEKFIKHSGI